MNIFSFFLKSFFYTLWMSTLILGILIILGTSSWFVAWMGLELNLMSFLPLMFMNSQKTESTLKYFLIQACASLLLIMMLISLPKIMVILLSAPLILKAGMAPFHFWFPQVSQNLSLQMNLILFTLQKIGPFYLISVLLLPCSVLIFLALLNALVGSLGGLNQLSLRKLLAFSSISHMGWMAMSMISKTNLWTMYLFVYMVSLFLVLKSMIKYNVLFSKNIITSPGSIDLTLNFLSLSGFPPFLGFIPKWFIILSLSPNFPVLIILMIILSTIPMYFYMKTILVNTTKSSLFPQLLKSNSFIKLFSFSVLATFISTPLSWSLFSTSL